jgi:hypothetical protein
MPQTSRSLAYLRRNIPFEYLFVYFIFICSSDMERYIICVHENSSLILREEHRKQVLEYGLLRAISLAVVVQKYLINLFHCDFSLP